MLYTQVLLLPCYITVANALNAPLMSAMWWASISYLIVFSLGLLCFGITLHYGTAKVLILPGNEGGIRGVANERPELNKQNIAGQKLLAGKK